MDSRMAQESLRRYVLRVLRVWRSWFIFSDDFLNGLQVRERIRSVTSNHPLQAALLCAIFCREKRWVQANPVTLRSAEGIADDEQ